MAFQDVSQPGNEDSDWALSRKIKLSNEVVEISERKSKHNWWENLNTPVTVLLTLCGLLWGIIQFNDQQAASSAAATHQEKLSVQLQVTQQAASAQLQATQQASGAAQALDQEHQITFDTYLDRMSDLLLIYHLQTSKQGSPVRAIAEARTLTAIRDLDPVRQIVLVRFLWRAGLVTGKQPVISLNAANLIFTTFSDALLYNINLSGALLNGSTFNNCDLHNAIFIGTNLTAATLENVNLTGVNMTNAILARTNLSWDDLSKVNLTGANLAGANLTGAILTPAQLRQVASLQGAIMPNGSKHP